MNKGKIFLAISVLIAFSGVLLLTLWGFRYNYSFGISTVQSYNIAPGLNCNFASTFSPCDSTYCSNLYVSYNDFLTDSNYTGLVPISFSENIIGHRNCWNMMPYSALKRNLQTVYPIGLRNICYINSKNKIILSDYSFVKLSRTLKIVGIILTVIGKSFLILYFIRYLILKNIRKPVYDVV